MAPLPASGPWVGTMAQGPSLLGTQKSNESCDLVKKSSEAQRALSSSAGGGKGDNSPQVLGRIKGNLRARPRKQRCSGCFPRNVQAAPPQGGPGPGPSISPAEGKVPVGSGQPASARDTSVFCLESGGVARSPPGAGVGSWEACTRCRGWEWGCPKSEAGESLPEATGPGAGARLCRKVGARGSLSGG